VVGAGPAIERHSVIRPTEITLYRPALLAIVCLIAFIGCAGCGRTAGDGRVTHPTEAGKYRSGLWEYEYRVWGGTLKHAHGTLKFDGKEVSFPMGSVVETPLGKFMSFDLMSGGQVGYNTGWLMTAYVHTENSSNVVTPVFLSDGTVNPAILATLPIGKDVVKTVRGPGG
jgi:hypothetical protein